MNQVVPTNRLTQFRHAPLAGLLLLILLLTACFGGGNNDAVEDTAVTDQVAAQATGSLVCSTSCLSQGQCGTTADSRTVILGHSTRPATRDHDIILANDSAVTILGQETHTVQDIVGSIFTLNFFAVQPTAGGPTAWVAGSCVNQTVQQ